MGSQIKFEYLSAPPTLLGLQYCSKLVTLQRKMEKEGRGNDIIKEKNNICPGCSLSLVMLKPSDMVCPQCKDPYPRTPKLHRYMEKVYEDIQVLYKRLRDEELRKI